MQTLIPSVDAYQRLPGVMTACSWRAGWRSLLLRAYDEPGTVEEFTTAPTSDQLIVLVTGGGCVIEVRRREGWHQADYKAGSLGMTVAGEEATLRWRNGLPTSTLQLHLPSQTIRSAAEALLGRDPQQIEMPNALASQDQAVQHVMLMLQAAMSSGTPDMYAETAADFLAMHLLWRHTGLIASAVSGQEEARLRRVNVFMHENLSSPVSLEALAREAGLSRFHLLRLFKAAHGETPFRRLTRLRMEQARALLNKGSETVTQIALQCGYDNPSHFASAFRREVGVSPTAYRRQRD